MSEIKPTAAHDLQVKELRRDSSAEIDKNLTIFGIMLGFEKREIASFTDLDFFRFVLEKADKHKPGQDIGLMENLAEICEYHAKLFREMKDPEKLRLFLEAGRK
jgi:hypothetical protein